jgi:hypothetical protein
LRSCVKLFLSIIGAAISIDDFQLRAFFGAFSCILGAF